MAWDPVAAELMHSYMHTRMNTASKGVLFQAQGYVSLVSGQQQLLGTWVLGQEY